MLFKQYLKYEYYSLQQFIMFRNFFCLQLQKLRHFPVSEHLQEVDFAVHGALTYIILYTLSGYCQGIVIILQNFGNIPHSYIAIVHKHLALRIYFI